MIKAALPVLYVVVAIGLFFMYVHPTYQDVEDLRQEDQQFTRALELARELETLQQRLLTKYNSFPLSDLERLETAVPRHIDTVQFVIDLDTIASDSDMRPRNIAFVDDNRRSSQSGNQVTPVQTDEERFQTLGASFSVTGTYEQLVSFLGDLERSLRIIDVTAIAFSAGDEDTGEQEYAVTVQVYWFEEE